MAKPFCGVCISYHWSCSYSLIRKRPGPRKGARQTNSLDVRRRLGRLEEMLDHPRMMLEDPRPVQELPLNLLPAPVEELVEPRFESLPLTEHELADIESTGSSSDVQPVLDALAWSRHPNYAESQPVDSPGSASLPSGPPQTTLAISPDLALHLLVFSPQVVLHDDLSYSPGSLYISHTSPYLSRSSASPASIANMNPGGSRITSQTPCLLCALDSLAHQIYSISQTETPR
jgi:hypothetical protein